MGIIINGQNDTIGPVDNSMSLLGTVSIGGTMTIEDFTNIDSVGLITARNGLHVSSGNVAIGHNNPLNTLHVKGPTGGVSARFTDAVNATVFVSHPSSGKSKIADAGGNYGFEFDTASVNILSGGSERLRITSGGDMGLGTASPRSITNFGSFAINGTAGAFTDYFLNGTRTGTTAVDSNGFTSEAVGSSTPFRVITNGSERLRIDSSGCIRVGNTHSQTTSSNTKRIALGAKASIWGWTTGNINGALTLADNYYWDGANNRAIEADNAAYLSLRSGSLRFGTTDSTPSAGGVTGLTEKFRITSGGDVGVGVDGPGAKLHVRDTANAAGVTGTDILRIANLRVNTGAGAANLRFVTNEISGTNQFTRAQIGAEYDGSSNVNGRLMFATSDSSGNLNERLRITSDGKIGIGVASPTQMMDITNTGGTGTQIQFRDTSTGVGSNDGLRVGYNGSGGQMWNFEESYIRFATNNAERVRITSTGNFGIGTASPTNKLHVYSSSDTGEIRIGGGNGSGNHRIFIQAHPSTAYIDSYGNNTHNPLYINADPLILNTSGSGKVLIKTTTNNDNQAWLRVDGMTDSGNIITGRVKDSTNNNNRTVLLFRMNQSNGFQFSGDIMTNSWTGNAKVNCHITVNYTNQNVEVDVVNATHSSQISKTNLRVVTADYGANRYLGIQKNGGGTGVFYINALVSSNIDTTGNGGIREVNNSSLGSVTTHGNLN